MRMTEIKEYAEDAQKRDRILAGDTTEWHKLEAHILYKTSSWSVAYHIDREEIVNRSIFEAARRWKPQRKFYDFATTVSINRLKDCHKHSKRHIHENIDICENMPINESPDSPCYGLFHYTIDREIGRDICL